MGRLRYDWYALEYTESNMFDTTGVRYEGTRGYEKEHHWDFDGGAAYELNYRPDGETGNSATSTPHTANTATTTSPTGTATDRSSSGRRISMPRSFTADRSIRFYAMLTDRIGPVSFDAGLRADNTPRRTADRRCQCQPEHLASGAFPFRTHRLRSPPRPDDLRRLCLPYQPTGHLATGTLHHLRRLLHQTDRQSRHLPRVHPLRRNRIPQTVQRRQQPRIYPDFSAHAEG